MACFLALAKPFSLSSSDELVADGWHLRLDLLGGRAVLASDLFGRGISMKLVRYFRPTAIRTHDVRRHVDYAELGLFNWGKRCRLKN